MIPTLVTIGFVSILGQVILLRELVVALFGSELVYLLSLAFWMAWIGIGALFGRRSAGKRRALPGSLAALGLLLPAALFFIRRGPLLLGQTRGTFLPFEEQLLLIAVTLAPAGLLLGHLFLRAAAGHVGRGGTFGGAYGAEALGGVGGGFASTVLLAAGVSASSIMLLAGASCFFAASFLTGRGARTAAPLRIAGAALLGLLLWMGNEIDAATARWRFPDLVESRDTLRGRLTISRRAGQTVLFENGAPAIDSEDVGPEEVVHPALLQRERMKRLLLIGGMEGAAAEALAHRPDAIDLVEADRTRIAMVERRFERGARAIEDRVVHLVPTDGRRAVRRAAGPYDAILIDAPAPASGGTNRFYTREFFGRCARLLRPGGVLSLHLPAPGAYRTPLLAHRDGSVYNALRAAFVDVVVLPGEANLFLASTAPLTRDPHPLEDRFRARALETRLVTPPYLHYLYTNDRFAATEEALRSSGAAPNSDLRPACYPFTVLLWLSRFYPALATVEDLPTAPAWFFLIGAAAASLAFRRRPAGRMVLLLFFTGVIGITVEFAVLLRFQSSSGALFGEIGLLLGGFMAGLAATPRIGARAIRIPRGGHLLLLCVIALSLAASFFVRFEAAGGLAISFAAISLAGAGVGALFGYASGKSPGRRGPLYAADLLGGSAGALAAGLYLLPFLGLDGALFWAGTLAAVTLLLA